MSQTLKSKVQDIESKKEAYRKATNYEATKQEYLSALESVERSLTQLRRDLDSMEFLAGVLTDVLGESLPRDVEDARQSARSVTDRTVDDFWKLVDDGRTDQYEQKIQQTRSAVNSAADTVKDELREVQSDWMTTISSAREIQKLVGKSRKRTRALNEIEDFVRQRMWSETNSVASLNHEWNELLGDWEDVRVDWEQFQNEHGLRDETIAILQDLADGDDIDLSRLNDDIAEEILSVSELRNVLKITI
jgi:chromosome segregation ATPase